MVSVNKRLTNQNDLLPVIDRFSATKPGLFSGRWIKILHLISLCLFFAHQADAQVEFSVGCQCTNKEDFQGLHYDEVLSIKAGEYPEGFNNLFEFFYGIEYINYLKVQKGTKITLYTETGYRGMAIPYYEGKYDFLFNAFEASRSSLYPIKSFKVETVTEAAQQLVTIESSSVTHDHYGQPQLVIYSDWYKPVGNDMGFWNYALVNCFKQNLGSGVYGKEQLVQHEGVWGADYMWIGISTVLSPSYVRRNYLTKITIPRGLIVTIKPQQSKTLVFPLEGDKNKEIAIYNLTSFLNPYEQIEEIQIGKRAYKIVDIQLTPKGQSITLDSKILGGNQKITNRSYTENGQGTITAGFENSYETTNTWEEGKSSSWAIGASVTVSQNVEVEAGVPGIAVKSNTGISIGASIEHTIEKSFTSGKAETESKTYTVSADCSTECGPRKECTIEGRVEQKRITYDVVTTYAQWDEVGDREISGTRTKVKSVVTLDVAAEADCMIKSTTHLPDKTEEIPRDLKFETLYFTDLYENNRTIHLTAIDERINTLAKNKSHANEPLGKVVSVFYMEALENEKGNNSNKQSEYNNLQPLNLYSKYNAKGELIFLTTTDERIATSGNYVSPKSLGYVYKKLDGGVALMLYRDKKNDQYILHPSHSFYDRNPDFENKGIQGYLQKN